MNYDLSTNWIIVLLALAVWELVWKGMALWRAARKNQAVWFLVLMVINTAGILPIIYLLFGSKEAGYEDN